MRRMRRYSIISLMALCLAVAAPGIFHWRTVTIPRERCAANLRILWIATKIYSPVQGEGYPPSFQDMMLLVRDPRYFICPGSGHKPGPTNDVGSWTDYGYISGLKEDDPSGCVLAFCPPEHHGGRGANVLQIEGLVRWYPRDEFSRVTNSSTVMFGTGDTNVLQRLGRMTRMMRPKH